MRETLAKEQFIDALVNSDMRLRIKQARPSSLNDAVRHAVELEAFNRAERRHLEGQGYMRSTSEKSEGSLESDMRALQKTVSDLQKSFETWRNKGLRSDRNWKDSYKKQANYAKPKYFICGSEDHMKRNCPSRHNSRHHNTRSDTPKKAEAHQAKHVASASGGLYAECKINNIITECLIDTGATLSILSLKAWDVISQSSSNELKKFSMQVFTASGSQIEVKGKATVIIEICGVQCVTEIVVADIDMDAILGLDFLKANSCRLDIENNTLKIKSKSCKLSLAGKLGCYRVTISDKVVIPARSETIIEGNVSVPIVREKDIGLIEPTDKPLGTGNSLVAKALVCTKDKVPLRIINLDYEEQELFPGSHVANLSFVETVSRVKVQPDKISYGEQMPAHLQDLYEKSIQGLTHQQCHDVDVTEGS